MKVFFEVSLRGKCVLPCTIKCNHSITNLTQHYVKLLMIKSTIYSEKYHTLMKMDPLIFMGHCGKYK